MSTELNGESGLTFRPNPRQRAAFFADPDVDRLLAVVNGLAAELAVVRARLDTHERLAAAKGVFDRQGVDRYLPAGEVLAQRQQDALQFVGRIWQPIAAEIDALRADPVAVSLLVDRIRSISR